MMGDNWWTSPPPKDREIVIGIVRTARAYWDEDLKTYVLSSGSLHIEDDPVPRRWHEPGRINE